MAKEDKKKADDDAAAVAAAAAAAVAETPATGISPEAQKEIDELKAKLDLEKSAREDAERRAATSGAAAKAATTEVEDANFQLVNTAIETVKSNTATLKSRYSAALSAGDYDAAADIQVEMSSNAAKLVHLENGKSAMEEERKNPTRRREEPIIVADPVERLAQTLTPRSAAWVRSHPKYVTDAKLNRKMIRAHEEAMDDEIAPDSDEYFEFVEGKLGLKKKDTPAPDADADADADAVALSEAAKGKGRDSSLNGTDTAPPALPPNRGGTGKNARRLTPDEQDAARSSGMTDDEYAAAKAALENEGRMGRPN